MSSVKRRKVEANVPSELLKKQNETVKESSPSSATSSPGSVEEAEGAVSQNVETEVKKTFKDLVSCPVGHEYLSYN